MLALKPQNGVDLAFERVALAQQLLRLARIVPEFRGLGEGVQFGQALLGWFPVKDASSAVPRTA
jgi:hypothetical protein